MANGSVRFRNGDAGESSRRHRGFRPHKRDSLMSQAAFSALINLAKSMPYIRSNSCFPIRW